MNKYEQIVDIFERRRVFLEDTVAHFNCLNRSDNDRGCFYQPSHRNTAGCAIGRHLPISLAKELDSFHGSKSASRSWIFDRLPFWMQEMDRYFLQDVQMLHDHRSCWNQNGLSVAGNSKVESIYFQWIGRRTKQWKIGCSWLDVLLDHATKNT